MSSLLRPEITRTGIRGLTGPDPEPPVILFWLNSLPPGSSFGLNSKTDDPEPL
jgi:hypothetical protein